LISLRDFFPKFLVFSSSDSVFWTRSPMGFAWQSSTLPWDFSRSESAFL